MSRAKGLARSHPGRHLHRLGAVLHPRVAAALAAGLPAGAEIPLLGMTDQGRSSTCFAHSASSSIAATLSALGKPLSFTPSPEEIAACTYSDDRANFLPAGQTTSMPKLLDQGAELQDVATALARWGIGPMGAQVADRDGASDVPDDPVDGTFPEPDRQRIEVAGQHLVSGEYTVGVDADAPRLVAASIAAKIAVWEGGYVNRAFETLGADDVATEACAAEDGTGGGHSQWIRAFRTNSSGALEFLYSGSWGRAFAKGGEVWVSSGFILSRWALWPMSVVA